MQDNVDIAALAAQFKHALNHDTYFFRPHCHLTSRQLMEFARHFGQALTIPYDGAEVNSPSAITHLGYGDDAITGRGRLPFHTDGDRGVFKTRYIILYCLDTSDNVIGGETVITATVNLRDILPDEIYQILTQIDATTRFRLDMHDRFKSLTYRVYEAKTASLMAYFPYPSLDNPHWETIFQDLSVATSRDLLLTTEKILTNRSLYAHQWRMHDLLVIDNERSIHARWPIKNGHRHLLRMICR